MEKQEELIIQFIDEEIQKQQQILQQLKIQILQANPTYQWHLSRLVLAQEIKTGKSQEEVLNTVPLMPITTKDVKSDETTGPEKEPKPD